VTIDPQTLPRHFESAAVEAKWHRVWQESGVYRYDPTRPRAETFVVDTPPPTVSGSLHVGHVFSFTHTDICVRYQRMRGKNIYYPMGWDDNGLPTERRVQNYYHVTCDPDLPYVAGLTLEPPSAEARKKPARAVSRRNFIELCHTLTMEDEKVFQATWERAGLSVDWNETYTTIDDTCRRYAQLSFLDLYRRGHAYNRVSPTTWDVDFRTAVAQAEVEDRLTRGAYHRLRFGLRGTDRSFVIATTRPELLPACVGVTAHPDDPRYRDLFGREAVTPLFHAPVRIFPSELADPEKGTGILMVCTFGDSADVEWWQKEKLPLRQVVGRDGRMLPVTFGSGEWVTVDADRANAAYAHVAGKSLAAARKETVRMLRESDPPALEGEPEPMEHPVRYYEKGERPLELIPTRQWFVRLMDKKAMLLERGREVTWHPAHMGIRYANWTENLQLDWCISRQRYFGVAFPVWYALDARGVPQYDRPILAQESTLPVDPMTETPPGYNETKRGEPGGFVGEKDVYDTWFTSSLTPQISSRWTLDPERHARLFPADIRPQAHDIIRTWAFYTIVKAALHHDSIPWRHTLISGFIMDPDRKKMSKSKGNVVTPMEHLEKYTADGVRYWAAGVRLGVDTAFDEGVMKNGRRLVVKIYNAAKFVLSLKAAPAPVTEPLDRAFLLLLRDLAATATTLYEDFEFALTETEAFFWHRFTDTYIELAKTRAKEGSSEGAGSAVTALRRGLDTLLRLLAPVLPYITEEVWSWAFAQETGTRSIHVASWPTADEFRDLDLPANAACFEAAVGALSEINKSKTLAGVSLARPITTLKVVGAPALIEALKPVARDVMASGRVAAWELRADPAASALRVEDVVFGDAAPAGG
jgi:valyl-tRNA synthetase